MAVELDDEQLANWKETFAKDGIIYETDDDYREAVNNLVGYFELLIELDKEQKQEAISQDDDPRMYLLDKDGRKILL